MVSGAVEEVVVSVVVVVVVVVSVVVVVVVSVAEDVEDIRIVISIPFSDFVNCAYFNPHELSRNVYVCNQP